MSRPLLLFVVLVLCASYLFALGWTGLGFASYATARTSLSLDSRTFSPLPLDEVVTLDMSGRGFGPETRVFMHMDVNNQDAVVGSFPLDRIVFDMELVGDFLYLGGNISGLRILDVSDPLKPEMLQTPTLSSVSVLDIERSGDTLYLSCGMLGMKIYQINDNGKLSNRRSLYTWSPAISSKVVGSFLYVASGTGGLLVYDLKNLSQAQPMAIIPADTQFREVEAFADSLYVAAGSGGVLIYKIGASGVPLLTGKLPVAQSARSITVAEGALYVLENGKLSQYDLADPQTPRLVAVQRHFSFPHRLYHAGDKIYVSDNTSGLGLVDNREKLLPSSAEFLNLGGDPRAMVAVGDYLYVAVASVGIKIIDPEAILPRQVITTANTRKKIDDFVIIDDSLYAVDRYSRTYLKNLAEKDSPFKQISFRTSNVSHVNSITKIDQLLFAADRYTGVEVFDILDPAKPVTVAIWPDIKVDSITASGNYLISNHFDNGLNLIDISDFEQPKIVARVTGIVAKKVFSQDGLIVVAGEKEGLRFYRIVRDKFILLSQIKLPFPLDRFSGPINFQVVGKVIYVANGDGGLMIVDIENPEKPKILSSLGLPGFSKGLLVDGEIVYVASRYSGLHTVDVSNLHTPRLLDSIGISDLGGRLQRYNDLLYLGNRFMGVAAIPLPRELDDVEVLSSQRLRVTVPSPEFKGRYSIQVSDKESSATLDGVLRYQ